MNISSQFLGHSKTKFLATPVGGSTGSTGQRSNFRVAASILTRPHNRSTRVKTYIGCSSKNNKESCYEFQPEEFPVLICIFKPYKPSLAKQRRQDLLKDTIDCKLDLAAR